MSKVYNNFYNLSIDLKKFFISSGAKLSKPQINILPSIVSAIINAENITTFDISKVFCDSSSSNIDSIQKKLWRFFNNPKFNGLDFFNSITKHIISNLKSISDNYLMVIIDHMYVKNNFVVLMFTLKVGSLGIPIYFKCDKTKSNRHREIDELTKKCLFSERQIFNAVSEVINLLSSLNLPIIFLADRWFCNLKLMQFIHNKNHFFCIRVKARSKMNCLFYDKKEKHNIYKHLDEFKVRAHSSVYHKLSFPSLNLNVNLSISRGKLSDDPWFIFLECQSKTCY